MSERSNGLIPRRPTKRRYKIIASKALSPLSGNEIEKRERDAERQRYGDTETQSFGRYGDSDDTHDADELPPSGACVDTLQKAAQMALADKSNGNPEFKFARGVLAFELFTGKRLPKEELPAAFNVWWSAAQATLPSDTDRDECMFLFMDAYDKAKTPLGSNVIQQALARVASSPPPPEANRYDSPKLKTLVHLCYELQKLAGDRPFFLSVRDAADAIGLSVKSLHSVSAYLHGLRRDGIIEPVEVGKSGGHRATRYFYVATKN